MHLADCLGVVSMTSGWERRQGRKSVTTGRGATETLSLPDELILMLLNEENGYFHQVPGWNLNCVVIGAVLAELSLMNRIDTDLESLFLIDNTETGNPILDPALQAIAAEPGHRTTQYWIERLAPLADSVIEYTLDRLVDLNILQHYEGDPTGEDMTLAAIDVTHRFLMECIRMYPIVPMSMRDVMNACVVEDYELPVGTRLHIAQTAAHEMGHAAGRLKHAVQVEPGSIMRSPLPGACTRFPSDHDYYHMDLQLAGSH